MSNIGFSSPDWGFNTQPPEGGWNPKHHESARKLCFNTQPPEGGWVQVFCVWPSLTKFQHTAARRRLALVYIYERGLKMFQHTAARRRLGNPLATAPRTTCFNTQPPEGGWLRLAGV